MKNKQTVITSIWHAMFARTTWSPLLPTPRGIQIKLNVHINTEAITFFPEEPHQDKLIRNSTVPGFCNKLCLEIVSIKKRHPFPCGQSDSCR